MDAKKIFELSRTLVATLGGLFFVYVGIMHFVDTDWFNPIVPPWLGWLAALNPLTFAIEPIRAAYAGPLDLSSVLLEAPYGPVTGTTCLLVLTLLTAALFLLIRPLLNRKLA